MLTIILTAGLALFKGVVLPALGGVSSWLIAQAAIWVKGKTNSQAVATSLTVLDDLVGVVVKEMQQTRTLPAKNSEDGGVGKLPIHAATSIKQEAVDKIKNYLGNEGLQKMVAALNVDQAKALELIESKVEAAVWHTKNGPPAGSQPDVRLPAPSLKPADFPPAPSIDEIVAQAAHAAAQQTKGQG